jgi:hypothetical protein
MRGLAPSGLDPLNELALAGALGPFKRADLPPSGD